MKRYIAFALAVLLFSIGLLGYKTFYSRLDAPKQINIPKGLTLKQITTKLYQEGIINDKYLFSILVLLKRSSVKAGTYCFKEGETLNQILYKLVKGKVCTSNITVIPGDNIYTVAKKLDKAGITKEADFLSLATDPVFLLSQGVSHLSLEGFIVPQTYTFPKSSTPQYVIKTFIKHFKKVYGRDSVFSTKFYKYMIVASLLQKEAGNKEEAPIIASVIYNRLRLNMPLQIDASVLYIRYKENLQLDFKDLKRINSPYNTYLRRGLPPTPISSFSEDMLKAAMHPAKTDYLFYFSPDGRSHLFSKTYKEHLKKVNQHQ